MHPFTQRLVKRLIALGLAITLFTVVTSAILFMNSSSFSILLNPPNMTFEEFLKSPEFPRLEHEVISFAGEPIDFCNGLDSETIDVLFVVHSAVYHQNHRKVIRDTIGAYIKLSISLQYKLLFVVGMPTVGKVDLLKSINDERKQYNDLLIVGVEDRYEHMTFKLVGWIKWLVKNCLDVNLIFKMDDDAVVNIAVLSKLARSCRESTVTDFCSKISCRARFHEPVMRFFINKNKLKYSEYPLREFPVTCPGLAVIIPARLLKPLLSATANVPFIWLDDVYLTCILTGYVGETINDISHFIMEPRDTNFEHMTKMVGHLNSYSFESDYKTIWRKTLKNT